MAKKYIDLITYEVGDEVTVANPDNFRYYADKYKLDPRGVYVVQVVKTVTDKHGDSYQVCYIGDHNMIFPANQLHPTNPEDLKQLIDMQNEIGKLFHPPSVKSKSSKLKVKQKKKPMVIKTNKLFGNGNKSGKTTKTD